MQTNQLVGCAAIVLFFGVLIGIVFDLMEGEGGKNLVNHILWGIGAASVGWLIGYLIPLSFSSEHRFYATICFGLLVPLDVMIARWMISKNTTPLVDHLDHYQDGI